MKAKKINTNRFTLPVRKSLAVLLAGVLLFEVVGIPMAEASQYEGIWKDRQKKMASLPQNMNPFSNPASTNLLNSIPSLHKSFDSLSPSYSGFSSHGSSFSSEMKKVLSALPLQNVTIRDIHSTTNPVMPFIILQDVHLNPEAQSNAAAFLESMIEIKFLKGPFNAHHPQ